MNVIEKIKNSRLIFFIAGVISAIAGIIALLFLTNRKNPDKKELIKNNNEAVKDSKEKEAMIEKDIIDADRSLDKLKRIRRR